MRKFKVGDRVTHNAGSNVDVEQHWNDHLRRNQGDIVDGALVVVSVHDKNVGLSNKAGPAFFYMPPSKLKLADPVKWQPKVGDRVRWLEVFKSDMYTAGNIYEIRKDFDFGYLGLTDDDGHIETGGHRWTSSEIPKHFELVVPLTIEVGKFYKTRDGRKVGPMVKAQWGYGPDWVWSVDHPFDASCGKAWRADGTFSTVADRADPADIIAEWVDEPKTSNDNGATLGDILQSAIGKPVTVKIAQPKFKVGDIVKRANGFQPHQRLRITKVDGDKYSVEWIVGGPGSINSWRGYEFELVEPATPTNPAIVCLIENGQPKPSTYPHVHADESAASKEAARLAAVHKGQKFGVYVLTQTVSEEQVYAHEWQRLAIKGEKIGAIKELRAANDLTLKGAKDAVEHWLELNAA